MRYALALEYDGGPYFGWQTQRQTPTVQSCVEQALSKVADGPVQVVCAGRTDTGVHALRQVVHFDCQVERDPRAWVLGCNSHLPDSITVLWARPVNDDFHARFSAITRTYQYRIYNRWVRPALQRNLTAWVRHPLNEKKMDAAAQCLLGEHDFSAFRASGCQANHPVREITAVNVRRDNEIVIIDITANSYLYHMVRNVAGALIEVGKGELSPDDILNLLHGKDRARAPMTAPASGLYLVAVRYPEEFGLPAAGDVLFPELKPKQLEGAD